MLARPPKGAIEQKKTGFIPDDATAAERQEQIKKAQQEDAANGTDEYDELEICPPPISVTAAGGAFRVPANVLDDSALTSIQKIIMIALYRFADENGVSTPPSKGLLAALCGITDRWLYVSLKELEMLGYIQGVRNKFNRVKRYQLKYAFKRGS